MSVVKRLIPLLVGSALLGACATQRPPTPATVPDLMPGWLIGYLAENERVNMSNVIPAPPAKNSTMQAEDDAVSRAALSLRGSARWQQGTKDAELLFPDAAQIFSCALGAPITEKDTPYLYQLLRRAGTDSGLATQNPKKLYQRPRPFLVNKQPICPAEDPEKIKSSGSYPSGHSAPGQTWAMILAELAPDRAEALFNRAQDYALSRVVCNVHWLSDTVEGRNVGSYVYAVLQSNAAFRSDMEVAREELAKVRAQKLPPNSDCAAEAEALKTRIPIEGWPNKR